MKKEHRGWMIGGAAIAAAIAFSHAILVWEESREAGPPLITVAASRPFIRLPFAKPTPLPEKEKAIRALRLLNHEPTGEAMAEAVREGSLPMIALFLKAGVSPEATDAGGRPLLVIAAEGEEPGVVEALLRAGANANAVDPEGVTPLLAAVTRGDQPLVGRLAEAGGDLHRSDSHGHNLLHAAAIARQAEMLSSLLAAGVRETGPCCGGRRDLLSHALESGELTVIETVLATRGPGPWQRETREALFDALRRQDEPLVRLLLAAHPEPPTPEGHRQPLLAYAIAWGEPEVLRLLLECGADANTPIGSPVEEAFLGLVDSKVTRHYLRTEEGMTPLMLAAGTGRLDCVRLLLEHGARKGATTKKWRIAALSLAARGKHLETMQVLLGKDPGKQRVRIEISLANQRANLWKDDKIVLSTRISTGRTGYRTPAGSFVVTDKHRTRTSNIYHVKMPYFMRLNCSDVGMHAGVVPDYPASHGCIRLPKDAAIRFFREADVGTLVTIR